MEWLSVERSCAIYMTVTDEQFERIANEPKYYLDRELVRQCTDAQGDNVVVVLLVSKGSVRDIVKGLNLLRQNYKQVCFWNREHIKFHGGKCYV